MRTPDTVYPIKLPGPRPQHARYLPLCILRPVLPAMYLRGQPRGGSEGWEGSQPQPCLLQALRSARPIAQPNPGFSQQLEQFYPYGALAETARLRRRSANLPPVYCARPLLQMNHLSTLISYYKHCRHGADWCSQHRQWLEAKLAAHDRKVEAGVLCSGECGERSACPRGTCRSPVRAPTRWREHQRITFPTQVQDLSAFLFCGLKPRPG